MRVKTYKKGGNLSGGFAFNGGMLTGPLLLSGSSEEPLEAISKQYVDYSFVNLNASNVKLGTFPVSSLPAFTGNISKSVGSATISLAEVNNNVGDVTKVTVNAAGQVVDAEPLVADDIPGFSWNKITQDKPTTINGYGIVDALPASGGEVNGRLSCSVLPTEDMHAVNRQYADTVLVSGTGVSIGDIVRKPTKVTPDGFLKANGGKVLVNDYPTLYSVIGDKFNTETQTCGGKPWEQQYEFNESQTGDIGPWVKEAGLPGITYAGNLVVTKNRVYVCGGYNGSVYTSTVYTAQINEDGTLGTWTTGPSIPATMHVQEMVVIKNKIYIFGGVNGSTPLSSIYSAQINSAGVIGSWVTETSLPGPLGGCKAIITKNRIYLCGGRTTIVYTSSISETGQLGGWTTAASLPISLYGHQIVQIKNRVYCFGGEISTGVFVSTIYLAYINDDGTLGNWVTYGSFVEKITGVKIFTTKNRLYLTCGYREGVYTNKIYSCQINQDGSLGTFSRQSDFPTATDWHLGFITSSRFYMVVGYNGSTYDNSIYSAPFAGGLNDYSEYYDIDNVTNYLEPGSGRPWQQQYQINDQQFDNISNWSTSTSLPVVLSVFQAIVTKNRVYLVGGYNGSTALSTTYTASINSDGTLGSWSTSTSLPGKLSGSQAIITKNRVYLLGGDNGSAHASTVYTASINSDGTLGTWNTGTSLPGAMQGSQAIITKNRVYLLGGYNGSAQVSTVYTAPVNSDGTLGAWSTSTSLPVPLHASQAIVTKNRVYLVGGWNGSSSVSTVYTAVINSDGTLGAWSTSTSLPGLLHGSQVIVTKNRVYLLGGYNGSVPVSTVYTSLINSDGTLGTWSTGSSVHTAAPWASAFTTSSKIYLVGGYVNSTTSLATVQVADFTGGLNDYSPYYEDSRPNYMEPGSGQPWRQQYQINTQQNTDITGWSTDIAFPTTVHVAQAVVTKNRVYIFGGHNGTTALSSVYTAIINADGTIGTWSVTTSLPILLNNMQPIITKNRIYLIGGNNGTTAVSNVYTTQINSDGTLGTWVSGTSLPIGIFGAQAFVTKNRVYILGGQSTGGTCLSSVYTATINIDGTLGTWITSTSLPGIVYGGQVVVTKNRVYLLGGFNGAAYSSTVYTAVINSDGTLSAWTTEISLPGIAHGGQAFVTNNRVYLIAGSNGSINTTIVYTAPINPDGTLGTWVTETPTVVATHWMTSFVTSSKIYLVGGYKSLTESNNTVQVASISGGLNDYSQYYQEDTTNYMEPGSGRPWQQQYQMNDQQSSDITGWTLGTSLPGLRSYIHAIITKNRAYILGGNDTVGTVSTVYMALINTDGTLGTWETSTSLPITLSHGQVITVKNRVYIVGGRSASTVISTVYTSAINSDGTLGAWTTGPALPTVIQGSASVVTKNRVYLLGGHNGSAGVNTVYTTTINSDGTLNAWTTGTSLPVTLHNSHCVSTKNRVYLIGGSVASIGVNTVYTAVINSDGTIGTWTTGTSLPIGIYGGQVIITKNRVYILGGNLSGTAESTVDTVYSAPINSDGTLGTWTIGTSINTAVHWSQAIVTSSKIYMIGGYSKTSAATSIVQVASFSGGKNDYSEYYTIPVEADYFYLPNETNREIFNLTSYIKY